MNSRLKEMSAASSFSSRSSSSSKKPRCGAYSTSTPTASPLTISGSAITALAPTPMAVCRTNDTSGELSMSLSKAAA